MRHKKYISVLVLLIAMFSSVATLVGIFSNQGTGIYEYKSIRGQTVKIYGKGIYHHMSADVAIQGIAQDYITLFIGVPLLFISLFLSRNDSLKGKFLLAGTLGYFLVSYLFYMVMGMYNELFLVYILLTSMSFFAFTLMLLSFRREDINSYFIPKLPVKFIGGFLIFNSIVITLLWLSVIIPPLLEGAVYPAAVEHYTTLIVQGLDLSILLPAAFLTGILLIKRNSFGYLLAPVYMVFLSILMTALSAKIIGMSMVGVSAGPAIIIIPLINGIAIICAVLILKNIKELESKTVNSRLAV